MYRVPRTRGIFLERSGRRSQVREFSTSPGGPSVSIFDRKYTGLFQKPFPALDTELQERLDKKFESLQQVEVTIDGTRHFVLREADLTLLWRDFGSRALQAQLEEDIYETFGHYTPLVFKSEKYWQTWHQHN